MRLRCSVTAQFGLPRASLIVERVNSSVPWQLFKERASAYGVKNLQCLHAINVAASMMRPDPGCALPRDPGAVCYGLGVLWLWCYLVMTSLGRRADQGRLHLIDGISNGIWEPLSFVAPAAAGRSRVWPPRPLVECSERVWLRGVIACVWMGASLWEGVRK